MPKYSFEIELRWPEGSDVDRVANALYEAGCDDGLFGVYESIPKVDFTRAAPSLGEAVGSAIRDVMKVVGLAVVAVHVEETNVCAPSGEKTAAQVSREIGIGVGTIRGRVRAAKRAGGHDVQTSAGTRRQEGLQ